ncbi:hypothetical protein C8J98_104140 [Luteibacter sp. OK325]|uniref:hypothetical protein n=1 Tax=Luteibacter sp. OK325 TaxID=2135670 RepID=UPI000D487519|nr:hypothetical protein [Luteibacter sp. OK325]PTR32929.1 hypothetical protein C8J98_104140 [Luteibacter sp. OK325]
MRALLTRPRFLLIVAGVFTAYLSVLVAKRGANHGDHAGGVAGAPTSAPPQGHARAALKEVEAGQALSLIGPSLVSTPEAANDVVFLTVAAAYGRCAPAHAHELGVMAARARLPVLAGLTSVLGPHTGSRSAWLAGIRELAARLPCDGPVDLSIGSFRQRVTLSGYVAAFPDSYFDPSLTSASAEFAGRSLAERATDTCNGVAYAVLPLDAPRAWQCTALRAQARRRVTGLCSGTADAAAQQIRDVVMRLPSTCQ